MEKADYPKKSDSARNPTKRRRSRTRKSRTSCLTTNIAQARREIVNALQLHRSSSANHKQFHTRAVPCSSNDMKYSYHHHQLMESMPVPGPTWSTTAPAVLCAPVPAVEVLEFEWVDNLLSSSHTWWMDFLNSLDGEIGAKSSGLLSDGSRDDLRQCLDANSNNERPELDSNGETQSLLADEWLIFPAPEE